MRERAYAMPASRVRGASPLAAGGVAGLHPVTPGTRDQFSHRVFMLPSDRSGYHSRGPQAFELARELELGDSLNARGVPKRRRGRLFNSAESLSAARRTWRGRFSA